MEQKEAFSVEELAKRWCVSYGTVYRLVTGGKLKFFKVGTNLRVTAAEVRRFENNEKEDTPQNDQGK